MLKLFSRLMNRSTSLDKVASSTPSTSFYFPAARAKLKLQERIHDQASISRQKRFDMLLRITIKITVEFIFIAYTFFVPGQLLLSLHT